MLRLDDDCLIRVFSLLEASALATACCVWVALSNRDCMWLGLLGPSAGTGQRRSKRLKQTGKQAYLHARAAEISRSAELSTIVMWSLRNSRLSLKELRKQINKHEPININWRDASGFTILLMIMSHAPSTVLSLARELLHRHDADPLIGDLDGMTPLMTASACGCLPMVKLLLASGAGGVRGAGFRRVRADSPPHRR